MKRTFAPYAFMLTAFFTFLLFSSYKGQEDKRPIDSYDNKGLPQVIKSINLNKEFTFAGEKVPTESFDVMSRLDRELLRSAYWHSNTILNIKKANRFFPTIERILKENDVPADMKYLAVAESDLSNATSPAGAKGFWQFMKKTGQGYGLQVNSQVDERYHLEKATKAFCKYIKSYKKKFGSWTLAAAGYNMGGPRLSKELKTQRAHNYYDLNLNQETSRYVFRILAIKEILNNPERYGFFIEEGHKYDPVPDCYEVTVNGPIENWGDFANKHGISYRILKVYNPWLISSSLTNKEKKTYNIKIPKGDK